MRRKTAVLLTLVMILSTFTACGRGDSADIPKEAPDVILVTSESGLGDLGLNDSCWEGCSRAAEKWDLSVYCIESESAEDYAAKITEAVGMEPQLILCAGEDMQDALMSIAEAYPEQKFAIIDKNGLGENVTGITFQEQDGAFLAGIAAGMVTESRIVSFIGGQQSILQDCFQYGFTSGVRTVASDVYVNTQYVGDSSDAAAAKMLAGAHEALGSDVIYQTAGEAGSGIAETAAAKGIFVIGTDLTLYSEAEDAVLCAIVRKADVAVYDVIRKLKEGTLDGADVVYTLSDGAFEICDKEGNLPEEVRKKMEDYTEKIAAGNLSVPYDWQTCHDYVSQLQH